MAFIKQAAGRTFQPQDKGSYEKGAEDFQQKAIEVFTKERDKFKNQKHRNTYHMLDLVIDTIKNLKIK